MLYFSSAINIDGSITLIDDYQDEIEAIRCFLPNEKAVKITYYQFAFYVLGSSGNLYHLHVYNHAVSSLDKINFHEKFVDISGSKYHLLALTNNGNVYDYGLSSNYQ